MACFEKGSCSPPASLSRIRAIPEEHHKSLPTHYDFLCLTYIVSSHL